MKKIIKTNGIITNVVGRNAHIKNPKARYIKNPNWANIAHKYEDRYLTSHNKITVSVHYNNGNHVNVWYLEGNPYIVFRNPVIAWFHNVFS